jgi:hypothetical protein
MNQSEANTRLSDCTAGPSTLVVSSRQWRPLASCFLLWQLESIMVCDPTKPDRHSTTTILR